MRRMTIAMTLLLLAVAAGPGAAAVSSSSAAGFLVQSRATVGAAPDSVFRALVGHIGSWWDPDHTFSGDARNLTLDARPGGCFCETLPGGGGVRHLEVVFVTPGKLLRMTGALGPMQGSGLAGSLTWECAAAGDSTRVALGYAVGGYFPGGIQQLAPVVDTVLLGQLARLKTYVETGSPTRR